MSPQETGAAPNPRACEGTLFGNTVFAASLRLESRGHRMIGVLRGRERCGRRHVGKKPCEEGGRGGNCASRAKTTREARNRSHHYGEPPRRDQPCGHLDFGRLARELLENKFLWCSTYGLWHFVLAAVGNRFKAQVRFFAFASFQNQNLRVENIFLTQSSSCHLRKKEEDVTSFDPRSHEHTDLKEGTVPSLGASLRDMVKLDQSSGLKHCCQGMHVLEAKIQWSSSKRSWKDMCLPSFPTQMISGPSACFNARISSVTLGSCDLLHIHSWNW